MLLDIRRGVDHTRIAFAIGSLHCKQNQWRLFTCHRSTRCFNYLTIQFNSSSSVSAAECNLRPAFGSRDSLLAPPSRNGDLVSLCTSTCHCCNFDSKVSSSFPSNPIFHCVRTLTSSLNRFGIIHPPSGAAALAFSLGNYNLVHMMIFMAGVCIAIVASVVINNLSDKRQYPSSWPILNMVSAACKSMPSAR